MGIVNRVFELDERETTVRREILGGITTFMALSYIIFVQPAMLAEAGTQGNPFPPGGILIATCVGSAFACVLMGFLANYPIALAPAMGHNVFFTYTVCLGMGYSWQQGLTAVFIGGCVFLVLSAFGFRAKIMEIIPDSLKHAIAGGIGLLLTLIGMEYAGLVVDAPGVLVKFGDIHDPYTLLAVFGLAVTLMMMALKVRGAILIGIILTAVVGCLSTALGYDLLDYHQLSSYSDLGGGQTFFALDFRGLFSGGGESGGVAGFLAAGGPVTVILTFLFLDVFDTVGTLVGVSERAGLMEDGKLPGARAALFSDSAGTVVGSVLGTSTITSYVESAAGVQAGARTGLANLVTAACFLGAILFYPFLGIVASEAGGEGSGLYPVIAPALIAVGAMMITSIRDLDWDDPTELIPAFLTLVFMPFTVSITEGIAVGFIAYSGLKLVTGRGEEVHWGLHLVALALLARYVFLM
ncbi:MAG: NCS2 family permease [Planctomycetota bacterium]